jgi:superfamily I DNA/RNA helicase
MAVLQNRAIIAYADTFFEARRKLPNAVLPDLFSFIEKFTNDPTARGLNYEKLNAMDDHIRSARVNQNYRAIIKIPDINSKNVYTLLWVDSHDEAYNWAKRKRIIVNNTTNIVEIFDAITKDEVANVIPQKTTDKKLFDWLSDKDLEKLNISSELFFLIRAIVNEEDLQKSKKFLPLNTYEYLSYLAAGFPFEEVIQIAAEELVHNEGGMSIDEAILSSKNRGNFYIVDDKDGAEEIKDFIDNPIDEWRVFLHPLQRKIVEKSYSGPARVLGGAGTGKTVVAMHRAKWLAENVFTGTNDRILFTTFSSNLARDIAVNLQKICRQEIYRRIEVVNLDKWVSTFFQKNNIQYRIVYGDDVQDIWEKAIDSNRHELNLPVGFFMNEYEKVILANEIDTFEAYIKANRAGMGIALNRKDKIHVWSVVESYTTLLNSLKIIDSATASLKVKNILCSFQNNDLYKSVIIDEGQDFGAVSFKLIRAIAGTEHENDIFIVGDAYQRIYGKKVVLKECGIDTRGRCGILKINYRTTDEIRKFAQEIVNGLVINELNDGIDEGKGYISFTHGKKPSVKNFNTKEEENEEIYTQIKRWIAQGINSSSICVTARTNRQLDDVNKFLRQMDIRTYEIKNAKAEDKNIDGVRIATMHRIKGLEFDCVVISGTSDGVIPLKTVLDTAIDSINAKELFDAERSLFYVAITRARKELVITSHGKITRLLA